MKGERERVWWLVLFGILVLGVFYSAQIFGSEGVNYFVKIGESGRIPNTPLPEEVACPGEVWQPIVGEGHYSISWHCPNIPGFSEDESLNQCLADCQTSTVGRDIARQIALADCEANKAAAQFECSCDDCLDFRQETPCTLDIESESHSCSLIQTNIFDSPLGWKVISEWWSVAKADVFFDCIGTCNEESGGEEGDSNPTPQSGR